MSKNTTPSNRSLPLNEWPEADKTAWLDALQENDPFSDGGGAAHWRSRTRDTNIQHYGRWLGFLAYSNSLYGNPTERITVENIKAYLAHLNVAPCTTETMLVGLKVMAKAMFPAHDWRWLQDICKRLHQSARPTRDKAILVHDSSDIFNTAVAELEKLPSKITSPKIATLYRDLFMLALLAARPLRVKNFTEITIGKHLTKNANKWLLSFEAAETKTHTPLDFNIPAALTVWLERYLEEVRPLFPNADKLKSLWITQYGEKPQDGFLHPRIVRLTKKLFGKHINPHLFRDCAASTMAFNSLQSKMAATRLLGQMHEGTTERHYIHARTIDAGNQVSNILETIRKEL